MLSGERYSNKILPGYNSVDYVVNAVICACSGIELVYTLGRW